MMVVYEIGGSKMATLLLDSFVQQHIISHDICDMQ